MSIDMVELETDMSLSRRMKRAIHRKAAKQSARQESECILCGKPLAGDTSNDEHPIPQWLLRYCDVLGKTGPTHYCWRSNWSRLVYRPYANLKRPAHFACNSDFNELLEKPMIPIMEAAVEGGALDSNQLAHMLRWVTKVRYTTGLHVMKAEANPTRAIVHLSTRDRLDRFDQIVRFFRVTGDLYEPLTYFGPSIPAFQRTPSSFYIRIKDLGIISSSDISLLSPTFDLPTFDRPDEELETVLHPDGYKLRQIPNELRGLNVAQLSLNGYSTDDERRRVLRRSRITFSANGMSELFVGNNVLSKLDGKVDFSALPELPSQVADPLAAVEVAKHLRQCRSNHEARCNFGSTISPPIDEGWREVGRNLDRGIETMIKIAGV